MINKEVKVKISNVSKIYKGTNKDVHALDNVNLDIYKNEFVCVIGSSGCGKSTLLNILAGLDIPNSGTIEIDGKAIEGTGVDRGVVFQQYALFPWLTVAKNVAFGLELQKKSKDEINKIVDHYLKAVGLIDFKNSYPKELSGGMARRAALARAIALDPDLIMYDEPFVGQDPITMGVLVKLISDLNSSLGITSLIVTHDVTEVLSIAHYVYILASGKVIGRGTPDEVRHSNDPRVKQFINGDFDGPYAFHMRTERSYLEEL